MSTLTENDKFCAYLSYKTAYEKSEKSERNTGDKVHSWFVTTAKSAGKSSAFKIIGKANYKWVSKITEMISFLAKLSLEFVPGSEGLKNLEDTASTLKRLLKPYSHVKETGSGLSFIGRKGQLKDEKKRGLNLQTLEENLGKKTLQLYRTTQAVLAVMGLALAILGLLHFLNGEGIIRMGFCRVSSKVVKYTTPFFLALLLGSSFFELSRLEHILVITDKPKASKEEKAQIKKYIFTELNDKQMLKKKRFRLMVRICATFASFLIVSIVASTSVAGKSLRDYKWLILFLGGVSACTGFYGVILDHRSNLEKEQREKDFQNWQNMRFAKMAGNNLVNVSIEFIKQLKRFNTISERGKELFDSTSKGNNVKKL